MAIFGNKKNDSTAKVVKPETQKESSEKKEAPKDAMSLWAKRKHLSIPEDVLRKTHITEKAAILGSRKIYTFEIDPAYGKNEVVRAFERVYGKKPVKVNIINVRGKAKRTRTGLGKTKARKKAMVYLKSSDHIDFV